MRAISGRLPELLLTCGIFANARVLHERAQAQLRAAREFFRSRGDRHREIRASHNLAVPVFAHQHEAAHPLFEESLQLQAAAGDDFGAAHTVVNIGASLLSMTRYEEALAVQHRPIALFERIEYTPGIALAYEAIARTLFSVGLHDSYESARAAVALLEMVNDRVWLCQALRTLASQCCNTERHEEALAAIVRAIELLQHIENPIFHRNVCLTLFGAALRVADAEGAALAYGKAEAIRASSTTRHNGRLSGVRRHPGRRQTSASARRPPLRSPRKAREWICRRSPPERKTAREASRS